MLTKLLTPIRALAALLALMLTACGGGGTVPSDGVVVRPLPPEFSTRNAVAYSPFRTGNRDTEVVTSAHVKEDLDLLLAGNYRLIRLFDSSDSVARTTLQVIQDNSLDIKVQLGVYVITGDEAFNQAEIARGIALANTFKDIVLAVSVGNETMVSWSFNPIPPSAMAGYIAQVRKGVPQPVTTDDNWAYFASATSEVLREIDFVALHTYSLADTVYDPDSWDWKQEAVPASGRAAAMMDASIQKAKQDYDAARSHLDRLGYTFLPIVIGETGWKAVITNGETYRAHPVNQKMYLDRLDAWRASGQGPKTIFYFEAFDEPWKGADDGWGLFNVDREVRYALQGLFPPTSWEPGSYTDADAVYYIPTVVTPITADRYTLYAETVTAGEARPQEAPIWNAWENGTTATAAPTTASAAEGTTSMLITPTPLSWGWGMTLAFTYRADDLTAFAASGYLNFSIKTTYPGKIEVGFLTGTAGDSSLYDVYIPIQPGDYGYQNDGAWHNVRIPISAITPYGAPAYGMPGSVALDMAKVTNPFVIADRYAKTGKGDGSNITTPILVDNIYWSK